MRCNLKKLILILLTLVGISYGQKQSLYAQYPNLAFREVFNDEQSTRMNGGVPTAVTFSRGVGIFNSANSSKVVYNSSVGNFGTRDFTIRVKVYLVYGVETNIISKRQSSTQEWNLYILANGKITFLGDNASEKYIQTDANSIPSTGWYEIVVVRGATNAVYVNGVSKTLSINNLTSTLSLSNNSNLNMGYSGVDYSSLSIDYIEIYNRALSASEISNMYLGVHHKDLELTPLINFDSRAGQIVDKRGNTITNTATTIKRAGSIFSANFDGSTSKLDFGNIDPLTGDITICGWIKARGYGEGGNGTIIENGKLTLCRVSGDRFILQSDYATSTAQTTANTFIKNKWIFIVATRTSSGIVNFRLGDYKTYPTVSGTANMASGTPVAGTTNIIIGNNNAQQYTWNGLISQLRIYKSILTEAQISQLWSYSLNGGAYYGD